MQLVNNQHKDHKSVTGSERIYVPRIYVPLQYRKAGFDVETRGFVSRIS